MDNLNKTIASNLQELRKSAGLTQTELADRLNYSDKAVSKWERGESMPDINILKSLADMYGVSVDYLLKSDHAKESVPERSRRIIRNNRIIITLLAISCVWLVATILYVTLGLTLRSLSNVWLAFVVAVPISLIVLIVFNSIWGRPKWNFAIVSGLVWSILVTLFLIFELENMWLIFLVGIPGQVIIIFCSRLKSSKEK